MHEGLAHKVLDLARELRECIAHGEHPGACVRAASEANGTADARCNNGDPAHEWYERLSSVLGGVVNAARVYGADPEYACTILLAHELHRLRRLIAIAEATLEAEAATC